MMGAGVKSSPYYFFQRGGVVNKVVEIPFWERYTLSIEEAAAYFRIGENKLRKIVNENDNADYILWNGNRPQIKRKKFEYFIDRHNLI